MHRGWKVLTATSLGSLMVFIDTSIVNVAFRSMAKDFGGSGTHALTWILSGYNIAFAAALLSLGRAADRFGRKRMFLSGVALFAVASAACGFAPSIGVLIVARIVQAIGGAMIVPSATALILPEFPPEKRSAALGISGAIGGLSAAFGPTLGGVLVDSFGWRSVFFINLPLSVAALAINVKLLHESRDPSATGLPDPLGSVIAVAGVGLLTATLVEGDSWGWGSSKVVLATLGSIALLTIFVLRCRTQALPVMDLSLFRLRFFTAANAAVFVWSAGFFGMFFVNVFFLQAVYQFSPMKSGLAIAPGPIVAALLAGPVGNVTQRVGHKKVVSLGLTVFSLGQLWLVFTTTATSSYWSTLFISGIIGGAGVGLTLTPLSSAANAYLPAQRFGMGSAINATGRQIGSALGIAIIAAIRASAPQDDPMVGFHRSWAFCVIASVIALVLMVAFFRKPSEADLEASRSVPAPAVVVD